MLRRGFYRVTRAAGPHPLGGTIRTYFLVSVANATRHLPNYERRAGPETEHEQGRNKVLPISWSPLSVSKHSMHRERWRSYGHLQARQPPGSRSATFFFTREISSGSPCETAFG